MDISKYKIIPINKAFTIYKIPFSDIERANVSLKNFDKTWSLKEHCDEQGWDIGINGAMFDTNTYQNVTDLIIEGALDNGGNYTDKGIAFGNDFKAIGAYKSTTGNSKGKPVDFIGGAPTLLIDGLINMDAKGLPPSYISPSTLTQRTAIGIDASNLYILSTKLNKTNLQAVANELKAQGCTQAINEDGGGSTAIYAGDDYFTQNRNIPCAFGIRIKQRNSACLDAGHSRLVSGKCSPDKTYYEYECNIDIRDKVKRHLNRNNIDTPYADYENSNASTELNEIIRIINASNADICVSFHSNAHSVEGDADGFTDGNGWEIFYYDSLTDFDSKKLAECIHKESIPFLPLTDRNLKIGNHLGIVSQTKMAAVLIETAFHTNKEDLAKLKSQEFREKCALAYAKGIVKYFGQIWIDENPNVVPVITPTTPTTTSTKRYVVQAGVFEEEARAIALKQKLIGLGIPAIIEEEIK